MRHKNSMYREVHVPQNMILIKLNLCASINPSQILYRILSSFFATAESHHFNEGLQSVQHAMPKTKFKSTVYKGLKSINQLGQLIEAEHDRMWLSGMWTSYCINQ